MSATALCDEPAFAAPARRRYQRRQPKGSLLANQAKDIEHAIRELEAARDEIAAMPEDMPKRERCRALIEPMGRLGLVARYCEAVLKQNGWEREEWIEVEP